MILPVGLRVVGYGTPPAPGGSRSFGLVSIMANLVVGVVEIVSATTGGRTPDVGIVLAGFVRIVATWLPPLDAVIVQIGTLQGCGATNSTFKVVIHFWEMPKS